MALLSPHIKGEGSRKKDLNKCLSHRMCLSLFFFFYWTTILDMSSVAWSLDTISVTVFKSWLNTSEICIGCTTSSVAEVRLEAVSTAEEKKYA